MNKLCILFWDLCFVEAINGFSCEALLKQEAGEMSRNWKILDMKTKPPGGKTTSVCLRSQAHAEQATTKSFIIQLQSKMIFPTYLITTWKFENEKGKLRAISHSILESHTERKISQEEATAAA